MDMKNSLGNVRFVYLSEDEYSPKRMTIAYDTSGDYLCVGWSLCHKKDQFSRKVGREKAMERMEQTDILLSSVKQFKESVTLGYNERPIIAAVQYVARKFPRTKIEHSLPQTFLWNYFFKKEYSAMMNDIEFMINGENKISRTI